MNDLSFIFLNKKIVNKKFRYSYELYKNWLFEEYRGILYENSNHQLKNKKYGERQRERYEKWKKETYIKFNKTIYSLVFNSDYSEFYILPIIGEYIGINSFKIGNNYFEQRKNNHPYYNYIGFYFDIEEAEKEKQKLEKSLNENENYSNFQKYLFEANKNEENYKLELNLIEREIEYKKAKEILNNFQNDIVINNEDLEDKYNYYFERKKNDLSKKYKELYTKYNRLRRKYKSDFKEIDSKYYQKLKFNFPKDIDKNLLFS